MTEKLKELLHKLIGSNLSKEDSDDDTEEVLSDEEIKELIAEQENEALENNDAQGDSKLLGIIQFGLLNNGDVTVNCNWTEESMPVAKAYGEMLYCIHSGKLVQTIHQVLAEYGSENITSQTFIRELLISWHSRIQATQSQPMISPSNVLKTSSEEHEEEE